MARLESRLKRLEDVRDGCRGGCAKCELVRISAVTMGLAWEGCDGQPLNLFELLREMGPEDESIEHAA